MNIVKIPQTENLLNPCKETEIIIARIACIYILSWKKSDQRFAVGIISEDVKEIVYERMNKKNNKMLHGPRCLRATDR